MSPSAAERRQFERYPFQPAPALKISFTTPGRLRTRAGELPGTLADLSVGGASVDVAEWHTDRVDPVIHFGSVSSTVDILSVSRNDDGGFRLHLSFCNPPADFTARVATFADEQGLAAHGNGARSQQQHPSPTSVG